jgi:hypothetical protein
MLSGHHAHAECVRRPFLKGFELKLRVAAGPRHRRASLSPPSIARAAGAGPIVTADLAPGTVGGIQSVKRMSSTITILTGCGANSGGGQVHVIV